MNSEFDPSLSINNIYYGFSCCRRQSGLRKYHSDKSEFCGLVNSYFPTNMSSAQADFQNPLRETLSNLRVSASPTPPKVFLFR